MKRAWPVLLLIAGGPGGCGPAPETEAPLAQPEGWDADVRLREAEDLDPSPDVLEVALRASVASIEILPGKTTDAWTYDGAIPGPLLRAKVGDRVRVHFRNDLPAPTTVHWHGVRVPVEMDGVPGASGPEIQPGSSFDYDFVVPDAGLYWYHPHVDSAAQVGNGLYGALLVEDPDEPEDLGDELVIVLSDIHLDESGALAAPDVGGDLAGLFGREGNHMLVNGKIRPTLRPRSGLRERWRIVNAARSRYFQLDLPGRTFTRIGGDGGLIGSPEDLDDVVLGVGERADLLVTPEGAPGSSTKLQWVPFDRGYGSTEFREIEELMPIAFDAGEAAEPPPPAEGLGRAIEAIDIAGATPIEVRLTSLQTETEITLGINDVPFGENMAVTAAVGETQVWTVSSEMQWGHPFHLHGFFFQVLDEDGAPVAPIEWKDTVQVPEQGEGVVRLAVRYDNRPGMWMFHCHILDHADMGMMGMVMLEK